MDGALLIDKPKGVSSFGVIDVLQKVMRERLSQAQPNIPVRRKDLPKFGHGGTLDPFATGLLAVCTGRALKLARYFLGSSKTYSGTLRFGQTTIPGDPTAPVSETSPVLPPSLEVLRDTAARFASQPYLQTPPMHSAKKKDGRPLYELAREGLEVDRDAKLCRLSGFEFQAYDPPIASFEVTCSSGTYIRTLAQDFARILGTVGMLDDLRRLRAGAFLVEQALPLAEIEQELRKGTPMNELSCWVPFDQLLRGHERAEATVDEELSIYQGRQNVLFNILKRAPKAEPSLPLAIYCRDQLIAVARANDGIWGLERVFIREDGARRS